MSKEGTPLTSPEDNTASRFNELPEGTQKFLSRLEDEDITLLEEGLKLVRATLTVGRFMKWAILCVLACLVGMVTLYDNVVKMAAWFQHPK